MNVLQWGLMAFVAYKLVFTLIPLWATEMELQGEDVSHFRLENQAGEMVPISNFKGKPLIINFWASWCVPCRMELPMLRSIYPQLQEKNKQLVGVNNSEAWNTIERYHEENPVPYPNFRDGGDLSKKLNIRFIPAIAIIDEQGKVESIIYGFRPWIQAYLLWWV